MSKEKLILFIQIITFCLLISFFACSGNESADPQNDIIGK